MLSDPLGLHPGVATVLIAAMKREYIHRRMIVKMELVIECLTGGNQCPGTSFRRDNCARECTLFCLFLIQRW